MDIVERLRNQGDFWPNGLANEAADEIERLRKENKKIQDFSTNLMNDLADVIDKYCAASVEKE